MNKLHPLVFICDFQDSTACKTLQLPRTGKFPSNYFKQLNSSLPIRIRSISRRCSFLRTLISKSICKRLLLKNGKIKDQLYHITPVADSD